MQTKNFGILLYRKAIKENDLFVKILSKDDQIITGIVYGGNSSKKKNIYQIGYYLNLNLVKKNSNSPYTINAEIENPLLGSIINDKYKLFCLLSLISLTNLSIIEGQTIKGIFSCVDDFINDLIVKHKWIVLYCKWLFELLKVIGYEIDYRSNSKNKYFDVNLLKFTHIKQNNSFAFPHDFLAGKKKIEYKYLEIIFLIFEYIFNNHHLINLNNNLPDSYISFKKLILNYLNKSQ